MRLYSRAGAAICLVDIWQWTPLVALAYLAARFAITPRQMEAARIDGASELRIWFGIIVPLLFPTLLATLVLRFLDAIREFDKVYVLTAGGPGSATEVLSLYIWRVAFRAWDFGYAAALCVFFYFVVFSLTALLVWLLKTTLPSILTRT
jgi:multiple sugar transport system permease protein